MWANINLRLKVPNIRAPLVQNIAVQKIATDVLFHFALFL